MDDPTKEQRFISANSNWMWSKDHPEYCPALQIGERFEALCGRPVEWHDDPAEDHRGKAVMPAGARLMRWELSHPQVVFNQRIPPRVVVNNVGGLNDTNADIRIYVALSIRSVFVSTSRRFIDNNGQVTGWVPAVDEVAQRYQYEIFAHGGIDVVKSDPSGHGSNPSQEELEIALACARNSSARCASTMVPVDPKICPRFV